MGSSQTLAVALPAATVIFFRRTFIRWKELNIKGAIGDRNSAMTAISLHLQRRFEQRWPLASPRGCVDRDKDCWNESHTINGSTCTENTKDKPAGVNRQTNLGRT
jgi:hypothetical protein